MAGYSDIFNEYINRPLPEQKIGSVLEASESKKAQLRPVPTADDLYRSAVAWGTDRKANPHSEMERDLQELDDIQLYLKYGADAGRMIGNRSEAERQYVRDITASRSNRDITSDTIKDVVSGGFSSVSGVIGLAASLSGPDRPLGTASRMLGGVGSISAHALSEAARSKAGVAVAQFSDRVSEAVRGSQSTALQARRRAVDTGRSIDQENNELQFDKDLKSNGELIASFKRIGRGVVNGVSSSLEDRNVFLSETANAVGSMLAVPPLAKAATPASSLMSRALGTEAILAEKAAGRYLSVADKMKIGITKGAPVGVAIGAIEGGGAYQQTVNEIMGMSHDYLMVNSSEYRELIQAGMDPATAKTQIADAAGLQAAATQAPAAAAIGQISGAFAKNPLKPTGIRNFSGDMLKESAEEFLQEGSGTISSNLAIQQYADSTKDISEGVGEAAAMGGLHGMSSAGALKTPGLMIDIPKQAATTTLRGARHAARKAGEPLYNYLLKQADKIEEELEGRTTFSPDNVRKTIDSAKQVAADLTNAVKQAVSETSTDESQKEEARQYIDNLVAATEFDQAELDDPSIPGSVKALLSGSTDRLDAVQRLSEAVTKSSEGSEDQFNASVALYAMLNQIKDLTGRRFADAIEEIADTAVTDALRKFEGTVNQITQMPRVKKALRMVDDIAARMREQGRLDTVSPDEVVGPRGPDIVRDSISVAENSPLNVNPETNDRILFHSKSGDLHLTPDQEIALRMSASLVRAHRAYVENVERLGLKTNNDIVSEDIISRDTNENVRFPSAKGHVKNLIAAVRSGNQELAAAHLNSLAMFAQHMQNKVVALNSHLKGGTGQRANAVHYQAKTASNTWQKSRTGMWINPIFPNSVRLAQEVANDAQTLATIANDMIEAFPDMGIAPVQLIDLDPSLTGPAEEVSRAYRAAQAKPEQKLTQDKPQEAPQSDTAPEPIKDATEPYQAPVEPQSEDTVQTVEAVEETAKENTALREFKDLLSLAQTKANFTKASQLIAALSPEERLVLHEAELGFPVEHASKDDDAKIRNFLNGVAESLGLKNADLVGDILLGVRSKDFFSRASNWTKSIVTHPDKLSDPSIQSVITHEFGHIVDYHGGKNTARSSDTSSFKKLYGEFVALKESLADLATPITWDYVDQHMRENNTAEFFAEAFRALVERPDIMREQAPNVTEFIEQSLRQAQGSELRKPVPTSDSLGSREEAVTPEEPVGTGEEKSGRKLSDGIVAAYPDLIGSREDSPVTNWFHKVFKLPKEARTRIIGDESPLSTIADVLADDENLVSFIGSDPKNILSEDAAEEYGKLLSDAKRLKKHMEASLKAYLSKTYSKKDPSRGTNKDRLLADGLLNQYRNGRSLNITKERDGDVVYNQELLEAAVLAGMQWLVTAEDQNTPKDAEDIANILGIREDEVTATMEAKLSKAFMLIEAKRSLAAKVKSYWGVQDNPDGDLAIAEGIPEGVAAEILQGFEKMGLLQIEEMEFVNPERTVYNLQFQKIPENSALYTFPDAIDQAVLVDPEPVFYIGEPPTKQAKAQLRNPEVEHTAEQLKVIEREQKVEHFPNSTGIDFHLQHGEDVMVELFGATGLDDRRYNEQDRASLEGQNQTLRSAYNTLVRMMSEIRNKASKAGISYDQLPIHFDYAFTKVNRMQMLGRNNPQSSKLIRELILPTRATVDLSSQENEDFGLFSLALAQALGLKIEQIRPEDAQAEVLKRLNGPLAPAVEIMQTWLRKQEALTKEQIATIKTALKGTDRSGISPVSFHALMEYARYLNQEDKSSFTTSLYVEADGKTNGPINAMQLLSHGRFDLSWLQNSRKGGLMLGAQGQTLNDLYVKGIDTKDLYTATKSALSDYTQQFVEELRDDPEASQQMSALSSIMDVFLPGASIVDGELVFDRDVVKNPLTITIYGSGARGIANKIVGQITKEIYARFSNALQIRDQDKSISPAQALFPEMETEEAAKKAYEEFRDAINLMTGRNTISGSMSLESFAFSKDDLKPFQRKVEKLFVAPLQAAIEQTVGEQTMEAATVLRKATQVQSIFLKFAVKAELDAIEKSNKEEKIFLSTRFVTRKQLREIIRKYDALAPSIDTGRQRFNITSNSRANIENLYFGSTLADTLRTPGYAYTPDDIGVAGIPATVIGFGDGLMMQILSMMDLDRTLKIFDGVHLPLDAIKGGSQKANQAVYETWQGNPLQHVLNSYNKFLEAYSLEGMSKEMNEALTRALFGFDPKEKTRDLSLIKAEIEALGRDLQVMADNVTARHNVLSRVGMTVDQMASGSSPYVLEGEVDLQGLTDDEIVTKLNKMLSEERAKKPAKAPDENIAPELERAGHSHASGARIIGYNALVRLVRNLNIPAPQKELIRDVVRTLTTKEYQIVFGSAEQLEDYANSQGISLPQEDGDVSGFVSVEQRTIFLVNPTSETLLHELIHAATYDKIQDYYDGKDLGPNSIEQVQAIRRLEMLMKQFKLLNMRNEPADVRRAWLDAMRSIERAQRRGDHAVALNEFMAWGLSNSKLQDLQQRTKAHPLVQLARDVVAGLKKLIWGRRKMPPVADDMLSNLRFNTNILLQTKAEENAVYRKTALFQSKAYGDNERLTNINKVLEWKLIRHLKSDLRSHPEEAQKTIAENRVNKLLAQQDQALRMVDRGFSMNMQERTTFHMIMAVMSTTADLDPNVMIGAQRMYSEVLKTIKVEDFMSDPDSLDPNDRYNAQQKYDVIVGNYRLDFDSSGRSSLLPTFLALAMVNDEFRAILSKLPVPKTEKATSKTLDAYLDNIGMSVLNSLSAKVSGWGKKTPDIQAAIDAMSQHMLDVAEDRESFIQKTMGTTGNIIDTANDIFIEKVQKLAKMASQKAGKIKESSDSKSVKTLAAAVNVVASIVDNDVAAEVAEGMVSLVNKPSVAQPLRDFINDIVGRTKSNALVYDMIKMVRDWVQQHRQQFREHLPSVIQKKFTTKLTEAQWSQMTTGLGKTDFVALRDIYSMEDLIQVLQNPNEIRDYMLELESSIIELDPKHSKLMLEKAKQLARYMNSGETGQHLLRNAHAIARLAGVTRTNIDRVNPDLVKKIDLLTSLYAFEGVDQNTKDTLADLARNQVEGLTFTLSYLIGQRKDELAKSLQGNALLNHYKGHITTEPKEVGSLVLIKDADAAKLNIMGYTRVADYVGSNLDPDIDSMGYYYIPASGRAVYNQGIMQNVRKTAYGVDVYSGFSHAMTGGLITDPKDVSRIWATSHKERGHEYLMPIFDENGDVRAYERSVDPKQLSRIEHDTNLSRVIGNWRGRQFEELEAEKVNNQLIHHLHMMWLEDTKPGSRRKGEYVNIFSSAEQKKDPVVKDAADLLTPETYNQIRSIFGDKFYIRRDMLHDAIGYRSASVGDAWTGITRWKPDHAKAARGLALTIFGKEAYRYLTNGEKLIQNFVTDARVMIVVKSVIVPMTNLMANIGQLWARGVPIANILSGMPKKTAEVHTYLTGRIRLDDIEAELRAIENNPMKERAYKAEMQSIKDSHRRLSIWPLIQAGEFSSISDGSLSREELSLTDGRLHAYMEKLVDRLPPAVRTMGKYAVISRDTALFRGLQRAVEYGDFLAKAVLYDELTKRKELSTEEALARITEEFVNYDRLPGRDRGYVESIGLLWFYNFKIRSTKVALSMIRNNPVHTLLSMSIPYPTTFGTVGIPVEDNLVSMALEGSLDYSIGPGMGLNSPGLHPWINLTH